MATNKDIAKKVIFKVLGNPADLKNQPCDTEYKHEVYFNEKIGWVFWTSRQRLYIQSTINSNLMLWLRVIKKLCAIQFTI